MIFISQIIHVTLLTLGELCGISINGIFNSTVALEHTDWAALYFKYFIFILYTQVL